MSISFKEGSRTGPSGNFDLDLDVCLVSSPFLLIAPANRKLSPLRTLGLVQSLPPVGQETFQFS